MAIRKPKRRYPFGLAIAVTLAALAIVGVKIVYLTNKGTVTLINTSTQPIVLATVEICGQKIQLTDIAPNGQATGLYQVGADDHYRIKVQFASGKTIEGEAGYVTSGFDFNDEFMVTDQKIEMMSDNCDVTEEVRRADPSIRLLGDDIGCRKK